VTSSWEVELYTGKWFLLGSFSGCLWTRKENSQDLFFGPEAEPQEGGEMDSGPGHYLGARVPTAPHSVADSTPLLQPLFWPWLVCKYGCRLGPESRPASHTASYCWQ